MISAATGDQRDQRAGHVSGVRRRTGTLTRGVGRRRAPARLVRRHVHPHRPEADRDRDHDQPVGDRRHVAAAGPGLPVRWFATSAVGNGIATTPMSRNRFSTSTRPVHPGDLRQHRVVVEPHDPDRQEADHVCQVGSQKCARCRAVERERPVGARGLVSYRQQVEDQDRDRDGEDAVAERLSPPRVHSRLVFLSGSCRPGRLGDPGRRSPACGRCRAVLGRRGGRLLDRADEQLRHVDDLQRLLRLARALLRGHRVAEHDQAVRAARRDGVRIGAERLVDPLGVDPLADPLLHPHPRAAGAAAEAALLAAVHLLRLARRGPVP